MLCRRRTSCHWPNLTATIVPTNYSGYHVSCFGMKDGSATVQVTGGVPPYIYDWTTGATTASVTDLAPGYIKVRVGIPRQRRRGGVHLEGAGSDEARPHPIQIPKWQEHQLLRMFQWQHRLGSDRRRGGHTATVGRMTSQRKIDRPRCDAIRCASHRCQYL
ncbi:MAG: SprB repeat-containing protein [Flavobacteriales bacterium]|nr:SprB repeat-containing protein [Flavobacteriales bacterium]